MSKWCFYHQFWMPKWCFITNSEYLGWKPLCKVRQFLMNFICEQMEFIKNMQKVCTMHYAKNEILCILHEDFMCRTHLMGKVATTHLWVRVKYVFIKKIHILTLYRCVNFAPDLCLGIDKNKCRCAWAMLMHSLLNWLPHFALWVKSFSKQHFFFIFIFITLWNL